MGLGYDKVYGCVQEVFVSNNNGEMVVDECRFELCTFRAADGTAK